MVRAGNFAEALYGPSVLGTNSERDEEIKGWPVGLQARHKVDGQLNARQWSW